MSKRHAHSNEKIETTHEDDGQSTTTPATEEAKVQTGGDLVAELQKVNEERASLQDQLLRTMAEMQNFRKRMQQEKLQLQQFATEGLVRELLPILDNFERTIAAAESGATRETIIEGVKAVDRQLRTALESKQVIRIAAIGGVFDPELHEAIATEDSHELPEGTITQEIEPGYRMSDKVIRPARVRVAKKP